MSRAGPCVEKFGESIRIKRMIGIKSEGLDKNAKICYDNILNKKSLDIKSADAKAAARQEIYENFKKNYNNFAYLLNGCELLCSKCFGGKRRG